MNKLCEYIVSRGQYEYRVGREIAGVPTADEYSRMGMGFRERMTDRFERMCRAEGENAVILDGQLIAFIRTVPLSDDVISVDERAEINKTYFTHELGFVSNICPDYISVIKAGFAEMRKGADCQSRRSLDALSALAGKYRQCALKSGRDDIAIVFDRVPEYGARTFREALQFFRMLHYSVWMEGEHHNTIGRFDYYMYPYLERDLELGVLTEESAYVLLCDFFISFNIDTDLYPGVQLGDNGQSMMLGGTAPDGSNVYNKLTEMCLRACGELKLIDPKINLRVSKDTPIEVYEAGTRLTAIGLGFPQYSNDDTVIEGLLKLGYDYEDAVQYTVAACWEFIIPGVGTDVPNIEALSYPRVIDNALRANLSECTDFGEFLGHVETEISSEFERLIQGVNNIWYVPAPFMDVLFGNIDVSKGAKYKNYGIHGTGISCGADSLAAIKKYVFDEKRYTADELIAALDSDFADSGDMLNMLRYHAPKVGNDDDEADVHLVWLTSKFADALKGKKNDRGGIYRAGTGSAMYYLWHAADVGASPDGRRASEAFGPNFSPSLSTKITDAVSVVNSFTKPDLQKVINGGPLTLEFHADIFRNRGGISPNGGASGDALSDGASLLSAAVSSDGIQKVARLVKYFVERGGHQIQLNSVNRDTLLNAQKNPGRYRNLIVRVWGWSAYFTELDKEYQDHVIARNEYIV